MVIPSRNGHGSLETHSQENEMGHLHYSFRCKITAVKLLGGNKKRLFDAGLGNDLLDMVLKLKESKAKIYKEDHISLGKALNPPYSFFPERSVYEMTENICRAYLTKD